MRVRTRFAPSPTGFLHIGSLRTALYAYALAKHSGGDFILRIEDTDQKRQVEGSVEGIKTTLEKFGLIWDEFYIQSERSKEGIYKSAAEKLVADGHAFYCQCEAKNAKVDGFTTTLRDVCRDKGLVSGAIKLKVPDNRTVSYFDFVHQKEISWNTDTVYDATLLKSDGYPTYHLAAMVDDLDMNISHILRGHDWMPSTPIHLLVLEYLGGNPPQIGHLTDILSSETGKKLSKRRDSVFVEQFLKEGYLPDSLLNFIMLLGWAPKDNREIYTLSDFVENFDINGLQEANPRFLTDKLDWFNGEYIRQLDFSSFYKTLIEFDRNWEDRDKSLFEKIFPLIVERIKNLREVENMAGFFYSRPVVDKKLFKDGYVKHLSAALSAIENITDWSLENINDCLMKMVKAEDFKTGDFFMSLRVAITGHKFTPPINDSVAILGREETIARLKAVL